MMKFSLLWILWVGLLTGCGENSVDTEVPANKPVSESSTESDAFIPLFIVAGQSNAEGNVRLAGLEAVRDALPNHGNELSAQERSTAREGYRQGVGDWCNPDEDYSVESADAALDALRAGGLDLSVLTRDYVIPQAQGAAYRWRFQEHTESLAPPYESTVGNPHPAHTTEIVPFGIGFGVWDDEEFDALFYGPELGFGMEINQTHSLERFDVLKVAMGGSSLYGHWAPDGPMRVEMYEKTNAFLQARTNSKVAGLIWFQGFNDQFEDQGKENYDSNLRQLIVDVRNRYGEHLPVVVVEARRVGDLALIADSQRAVAESMEAVSLVESDGLSDCFHYDAASQLVIGQRSAKAMLELLKSKLKILLRVKQGQMKLYRFRSL